MRNPKYKLEDLIRIWMKACFKRAQEESNPMSTKVSLEGKKKGAK